MNCFRFIFLSLCFRYYAAFPALSDVSSSTSTAGSPRPKQLEISPIKGWAEVAQKVPEMSKENSSDEADVSEKAKEKDYEKLSNTPGRTSESTEEPLRTEIVYRDLFPQPDPDIVTEALVKSFVGKRFTGRFERVMLENREDNHGRRRSKVTTSIVYNASYFSLTQSRRCVLRNR